MKRVYKVLKSSERNKSTDEIKTARSQWADKMSFRNLIQRLSERSRENISTTPVLRNVPTQMPLQDVPETFKGRIFYV